MAEAQGPWDNLKVQDTAEQLLARELYMDSSAPLRGAGGDLGSVWITTLIKSTF